MSKNYLIFIFILTSYSNGLFNLIVVNSNKNMNPLHCLTCWVIDYNLFKLAFSLIQVFKFHSGLDFFAFNSLILMNFDLFFIDLFFIELFHRTGFILDFWFIS